MTIITIDTETQGLNTQKFIMGVITHKTGKAETFNKKEEMWERLIELGEKHKKKKECLVIYAHNMAYDLLAIRPEQLPEGMYQFSHNPFILDREDQNERDYRGRPRIYMKFLSTTSLYRGPLSEIGDALGYPKSETPEWLKQDNYEPNFLELNEAREYMIRDSAILMKFVTTLKEKLKELGVQPRHLITAPQIGINYFLQGMKKSTDGKNSGAFFKNYTRRILHNCQYPDIIDAAARAGRVEVFGTGRHENVTHIDINSLWPWAMYNLRTPDLRTETLIEKPLENGYTQEELFSKIGVSTVAIEAIDCDYGVLPIRTEENDEITYPHKQQLLIGTWTNQEIQAAIKRGYKLKNVIQSVIYQWTDNPFKEIITTLYKGKQEAENPMDRYIYKMLLNGAIGKFKQRRYYVDYKWGYPSEETEYLKNGYEVIEIWENKRLYAKKGDWTYPPFSAPILYTLITADARLRLLEDLEKIPREKIYYCDTDCIVACDKVIQNAKFIYSKDLGDYKIEHLREPLILYGKKNYMIGEEIKASGIGKLWQNPTSFKQGYINYKKMLTAHHTPDTSLIGTFQTITRNLWDTLHKTEELRVLHEMQPYFVDGKHSIIEYDDIITEWMASKEHTEPQQPSSDCSS